MSWLERVRLSTNCNPSVCPDNPSSNLREGVGLKHTADQETDRTAPRVLTHAHIRTDNHPYTRDYTRQPPDRVSE